MTHVTCRLTAKNRDQLRNPTLGSRVWAIFTFIMSNGVTGFNEACRGVVLVPRRAALLRDERQALRQRRAGVPRGHPPRPGTCRRTDPQVVAPCGGH